MEVINVEEIMQEIRKDIKEKGYTADMLSFQDVEYVQDGMYEYDQTEFKRIVSELENKKRVPWYWDLEQNGIIRIFKRFIRKSVTFLIAPITDKQNEFNCVAVDGFEQLAGYTESQKEEIEKNRKNVILLEEKIEKMQREIELLKNK